MFRNLSKTLFAKSVGVGVGGGHQGALRGTENYRFKKNWFDFVCSVLICQQLVEKFMIQWKYSGLKTYLLIVS